MILIASTTDFYQQKLDFFREVTYKIYKFYVAVQVDDYNQQIKMQSDSRCITLWQISRIKTALNSSLTLLDSQQYIRQELLKFAKRVMQKCHTSTMNWITNQNLCSNCKRLVADYTLSFQEQLNKMNSFNNLPEFMDQKQFSCALRTMKFFFDGIQNQIKCKEDIDLKVRAV